MNVVRVTRPSIYFIVIILFSALISKCWWSLFLFFFYTVFISQALHSTLHWYQKITNISKNVFDIWRYSLPLIRNWWLSAKGKEVTCPIIINILLFNVLTSVCASIVLFSVHIGERRKKQITEEKKGEELSYLDCLKEMLLDLKFLCESIAQSLGWLKLNIKKWQRQLSTIYHLCSKTIQNLKLLASEILGGWFIACSLSWSCERFVWNSMHFPWCISYPLYLW